MSLFITFEGAEGSGKSSQTADLYNWLLEQGIPAVLTHEPGGTDLGEKVTGLLKWARDTAISPLTELMLFNASRSQLVQDVIKPALDSGSVVICDRFFDSTTAYQSYGRGLDLDMVRNVNLTATGGLVPDLTVLLDLSIEDGLARKAGDELDRFELEDLEFHRKIREGYLALAEEEPERWLVIDAMQSRDAIFGIIRERVAALLGLDG
ncbi:MAG: dTMP kinase [Dehalococcoidales bacterium]|nr:dTMP kinase [Dehalococcoidales bacterium]